MNKNFYVYVYSHPVSLKPFYVGLGRGARHLSHLKESRNPLSKDKNTHKINTIRKILSEGLEPSITIVKTDLTRQEAIDLEISLISFYGRVDLKTGTLTNMTGGGDGRIEWSDEDRKALSNKNKNNIAARDQDGNALSVKNDDPRWLSGELVGINKGKKHQTNKKGFTTVRDQDGNTLSVSVDDSRLKAENSSVSQKEINCPKKQRIKYRLRSPVYLKQKSTISAILKP